MKLPLIILVLLVIIFLAYVISSKLLKKKDGYEIEVKSTPEIDNTPEEDGNYDRTIMTGTFKGTRNKLRGPKNSESDKKMDTKKTNKKKEPVNKGEKRKYSPRKKKEDKGDDLLLS